MRARQSESGASRKQNELIHKQKDKIMSDNTTCRIGIGGPVGSGKTALIEAITPRLLDMGYKVLVITNDVVTTEDAKHVRKMLKGILVEERIIGVETGACPHTAVREDPSMNIAAVEEMEARFPDGDVVLIESGGDNLTLTFSPALVDFFIYVIDVAAGDKIPRKDGPGISQSDILVINKTDLVKDPADLEARKAELKALGVFDDVYTVSVRDNDHCEDLFDALSRYAVEGPHYFDDDAYTDMPEKELVAEVIREKALLFMRDEIPHGIAVVMERFKERPGTDLIDIDVNIYCERESHKGMVIGKGGAMLKKIASAARADCEEFLGCRVNLQCWVKVKSDWRDNEFLLNNFGFKQNSSNR